MEIIKRDDIAKGLLIYKDGKKECFGGVVRMSERSTKEQKQKRDKAIVLIWELKKSDWIMKDLAFVFGLNIDTIYTILKEARERKILSR